MSSTNTMRSKGTAGSSAANGRWPALACEVPLGWNHNRIEPGAPGAGKTITLLRLAYPAARAGRKVCFADCKGTDPPWSRP
jgi:hypothetical protein